MRPISEIAQRTLSELEEAWEENMYTLINTVYDPPSSAGLTEYCGAVRELYEEEFVRITVEAPDGGDSETLQDNESRRLLSRLEDLFRFQGEYWTVSGRSINEVAVPQLLITEAGLEVAEQLLEERGYQWWKRRS